MDEPIKFKVAGFGFWGEIHLSMSLNKIFSLQRMSFNDENLNSNFLL